MEITVTPEKDIQILSIIGSIDSSRSAIFDQKVNQVLQDGAKKVIFDFDKLDYTSSAGLRVVLSTAKKIKAVNGAFALCALKPNVLQVFELSGFTSILKIYPDRPSALAAIA